MTQRSLHSFFSRNVHSGSPTQCPSELSQVSPKRESVNYEASSQSTNLSNGTNSMFGLGTNSMIEPERSTLRPFVPGLKRVEDRGDEKDPFDRKRQRLLEAIGVDAVASGNQNSAWAQARAKFEWLNPENIRDGQGRRPCDAGYDVRTVTVPRNIANAFSKSQQQYWKTKCQYMDTLLFFKVGKFYELYELDAEIGHRELDWKLTVSGVGKCRQVGVPESGIDDAVTKLVARGYKVGRMEQVETGEEAKARGGKNAMVQRELTKVLTPSTLTDGILTPEAVHLLALSEEVLESQAVEGSIRLGFAFVDTAAGKFFVGTVQDDLSRAALGALLMQLCPRELLYELGGVSPVTHKALKKVQRPGLVPMQMTGLQPVVEFKQPADVLKLISENGYFKTKVSNKTSGYGDFLHELEKSDDGRLSISALGALICHLQRLKADTELLSCGYLLPYEVYSGFLRLDGQTVVNLELLENSDTQGKEGTLIGYLDSCVSAAGKRLLRRWICHPLSCVPAIESRLDAVEELLARPQLAGAIRAGLHPLPDLERLVGRARGLASTPGLGIVPVAAEKTHHRRVKAFSLLIQSMREACDFLTTLKGGTESEGPPTAQILQAAACAPDDEGAQHTLVALERAIQRPSVKGGVPVLRPEGLKQPSEDEDRLMWEAQILSNLLTAFNEHSTTWLKITEHLAILDVLTAFAAAAGDARGKTCRPTFVRRTVGAVEKRGGGVLDARGLWHPYAMGRAGNAVVPNDVNLGGGVQGEEGEQQPRAVLLTGPNMGGKSTLLRATCVGCIMAQLGCFVPAETCVLSPVDTIFTRLGASDRIMAGESTFMVECLETASVLQHATQDSVVVLDELGRGTSTFDGYAIAYSVLKHLTETVDCRLLFATHYHSLTLEFALDPAVSLCHMAFAFDSQQAPTREMDGSPTSGADILAGAGPSVGSAALPSKRLLFLYKLQAGASPKSYGLQVATMAGLPCSVVEGASVAASRMLASLEGTFESAIYGDDFSGLHRQWLEALVGVVSPARDGLCLEGDPTPFSEEDKYETLLCVWHEIRKSAI